MQEFKNLIETSRQIVGFTGAGISTDAGISDYRSQGGIWEKFTPVYLSEFVNEYETLFKLSRESPLSTPRVNQRFHCS